MPSRIYTAPPDTGTLTLGKTLPGLLYEACARYTNPRAFNQPWRGGWQAFSLDEFRRQSEEIALGLLDVGVARGDRVALYMESDVYFCLVDMGCLIAGLVDVPVYLTHAPEQVQYVLAHSEARVLCVSDLAGVEAVAAILPQVPAVRTVIVAELNPEAPRPTLPEGVQLLSLDEVRVRGRQQAARAPRAVSDLVDRIRPGDLATIIYTSGTTGRPKGVMLSHENISSNALTSFSGLGDYEAGADGEVVLSFLPLTHVFARMLQYGYMHYGSTIYFTTPDELSRDLKQVRPTTFATVPRVLEKVYASILKRITEMQGLRKLIANWALALGARYRVGETPGVLYRMQLLAADLLVFSRWRAALGGRVRHIIAGGAAMSAELTNLFAAAGIMVLQGYGLTETSPVIAFNRPGRNRPGTVGELIPGVEVRIADDGEILTRGPHVMQGYFKDEERTREVVDAEGWFHTGDIGAMTDDGFLRITDRKKDLFKLSTGKYVTPQLLESRLVTHPLVSQAIVLGHGYKFCTALLFPEEETLRVYARSRGLDVHQPLEALLREPRVTRRYRQLVEQANEGMDHWSTIKRFILLPTAPSVANGLLTPTMKMRRPRVRELFAREVDALYAEATDAEAPAFIEVIPPPADD